MKQIIIEITDFERAAIVNEKTVEAFFLHRRDNKEAVGDIFFGRVTDVHKGLQGAFVDIGLKKRGLINKKDLLAFMKMDTGESHSSRKSIDDFITEGQEIIVQIKKAASNDKGPLLSQIISIVDDAFIYMPNSGYIAVSHKLPSPLKVALKEQLTQNLNNQEGGIIRTSAQYVPFKQVIHQLDHTRKIWHHILKKAESTHRPGILSKESGVIKQVIRNFSYEVIDEILINNYEGFKELQNHFQSLIGRKPKIIYKDVPKLFEMAGVEKEFERATKKRVPLENGAYLLIEPTEALTVIDINTGSYRGEQSWEETAFVTNELAVIEIARQLRLRQIGGMIIIDLIKMASEKQYQHILETLNKALDKDRTTTKVFGITQLGLIEMTRKYSLLSIYDFLNEKNNNYKN